MANPYSPPEAVDQSSLERVALPLKMSSIGSFVCGFVAFMAYYGYPAFMNPSWYFGYLPALAFLSCILGLTALAFPWQPSRRKTISLTLIAVGTAFLFACFAVAAALDATTNDGVFWLLPRVLLSVATSITAWIATKRIHGAASGRRLASIGLGFGVLQSITSVVDILYTEWAT